MKRTWIAVVATGCALAGSAGAAEFQPMGALGIGGAGVARTYDAIAPYWNPAGLAFSKQVFSSRINAGAGMQINSTMANNVDRVGKLDVTSLTDLNIVNPTDTTGNMRLVATAAEFVGVVNDLEHNDGTLVATADAVLGFQYRNFAIGGFSTMELASLPNTDTARVAFGGVTNTAQLATAIGAGTAAPGTFFNASQRSAIAAAFAGNTGIANAFDSYYTSNRPATEQTPEQLKDALVHMGTALVAGQQGLDSNQTTLEYLGLLLIEFPVSYGHLIDLGPLGKLGLGGSFKVMQGRAYIGESQIVKLKDSGDIVKNLTDHYKDSTSFGLDLGLLWKYSDWVGIGIVAKNLNSPEFETPQIASINRGLYKRTIRVKPQVRSGIAIEPLTWLTLAADLDLTENETIMSTTRSRHLGAGFEVHPMTWLKMRGGIYDNLSDQEVGPVGTLGLTFGIPWVNFDLDGAAAFKSGKYKDTEYPREVRVQLSLNVLF